MSDMMNLWNKMDSDLQGDYAYAYDTTKEILVSSMQNSLVKKESLWTKLRSHGMDNTGVLYIGEFDIGDKKLELQRLYYATKDNTMAMNLNSMRLSFTNEQLNTGRISKESFERRMEHYKTYDQPYYGPFLMGLHTEWPFPKSKEVSLCKFVAKWFDEKTSQVFSKIYNGQKRKFYASVRPSDYLMISDSESISSCHSTFGDNDYRMGNIDYMLDKCTFIVYSGNPEGESFATTAYGYDDNKDCETEEDVTLFSPNMHSRLLCFYNGTHVAHGRRYGDAFDTFSVLNKLADLLGVKKETHADSYNLVEYEGRGYDDGDYTVLGPKVENWDKVSYFKIGE